MKLKPHLMKDIVLEISKVRLFELFSCEIVCVFFYTSTTKIYEKVTGIILLNNIARNAFLLI